MSLKDKIKNAGKHMVEFVFLGVCFFGMYYALDTLKDSIPEMISHTTITVAVPDENGIYHGGTLTIGEKPDSTIYEKLKADERFGKYFNLKRVQNEKTNEN